MLQLDRLNKRSVPALFAVLVAVMLFVLNPVTSVAHQLQAHTTQSQQDQSDDSQHDSGSSLCKLCLGLTGGASGAHDNTPQVVHSSLQHEVPNAAPVGHFRPVCVMSFQSRAPPISLV